MNNKKLIDTLLYALPAAAAAVNVLPWCVRMRFMGEGEKLIVEYFSGYSLLPPGYGVWTHMVTGLCGVILAVLGLIHFRTRKPRILSFMMSISIVGVLMGMSPLLLGTGTVVSTLAALAIGAEAALLYYHRMNM